ncbi:hypothetical protein [Arthrobacter sp. HMWF013]|uniref:hypothetical protein n=1 Tax=Arthrobacter sp. HMWF013 TaxID=2056849 RepID=UPI000D36D17B|nr:hypothetical protein [Arthrobacter sp. HMWF013]PTT69106.1 hypothetical protein DBR22_04800 [Arthrobacter sp. HMWF013]
MKSPFNHAFILSDPRVLGLEVHTAEVSDAHLTWSCSYSGEDLDEDDDFRVVIATLHGANDEATFTVTMGSIFVDSGLVEVEHDYAEYLAKSEALESLYDLCRLQARTALGMLELEKMFEMPMKAPQPKITEMGDEDQDVHQHDDLDEDAQP